MKAFDKEVIWIVRGSQRREVFLNLPNTEFMPNKLRKTLNENLKLSLSLREISRHLKDFERLKFIECLNKGDPYNKIFRITDKGNKIKKKINKFS